MCIHSCDQIYAHCMGYETWDSSREAGSTILFPSLNQWKMPIVCQMFTSHYAQVKKPYLKVKKGNMSTLTGGKSTTDRTWSSEPQSMCMTVSRCSLWICKHIPRALNEYRVARKHVRNYRRKLIWHKFIAFQLHNRVPDSWSKAVECECVFSGANCEVIDGLFRSFIRTLKASESLYWF